MLITIGSLNVDHVYQVAAMARVGETVSCARYDLFSGGKGLNQALAAARAGAQVALVGCVGQDGQWLTALLAAENVNVAHVHTRDVPTGHAIIQVSRKGENSILIYGGANQSLTLEQLEESFAAFSQPSYALLQNETNLVPEAIRMAKRRGIPVALNPVPINATVLRDYPHQDVSLLFVNEIEGEMLTGQREPEAVLAALEAQWPETDVILTLGAAGAQGRVGGEVFAVSGRAVDVVDTTAAGDTFIGYCLAGLDQGQTPQEAVRTANRAAALSVTRQGAAPSIPRRQEVRNDRSA